MPAQIVSTVKSTSSAASQTINPFMTIAPRPSVTTVIGNVSRMSSGQRSALESDHRRAGKGRVPAVDVEAGDDAGEQAQRDGGQNPGDAEVEEPAPAQVGAQAGPSVRGGSPADSVRARLPRSSFPTRPPSAGASRR